MFENKKTETQGVHYSRYIMSWLNSGGRVCDFSGEQFENWLKMNDVTDQEIQEIREICVGGGKLELEVSAKPYIHRQREENAMLDDEIAREEQRRKAAARPAMVLKRRIEKTGPALRKALKEVGWIR